MVASRMFIIIVSSASVSLIVDPVFILYIANVIMRVNVTKNLQALISDCYKYLVLVALLDLTGLFEIIAKIIHDIMMFPLEDCLNEKLKHLGYKDVMCIIICDNMSILS